MGSLEFHHVGPQGSRPERFGTLIGRLGWSEPAGDGSLEPCGKHETRFIGHVRKAEHIIVHVEHREFAQPFFTCALRLHIAPRPDVAARRFGGIKHLQLFYGPGFRGNHLQFGHSFGIQAQRGAGLRRPEHVPAPDMLIQPHLAVLLDLVGVVMSAGLDRECPGHTGLEPFETLQAAFVSPVMVVGPVQKQGGCADCWHMGLRRHPFQKDALPGGWFRHGHGRIFVHPHLVIPVVDVPSDPEMRHHGFDSRIGSQIPHHGSPIGIAACTQPAPVYFLLPLQITQRPALQRVPEVIRALARVRDLLPVFQSAIHSKAHRPVHVPVPEPVRVPGIVGTACGFSAVIMGHHRPALLDHVPARVGSPHPPVHIQESGRLRHAFPDTVLAVNPDLLPQHIRADVTLAHPDPVHSLVGDHFLPEIAGIRIILAPQQAGFELGGFSARCDRGNPEERGTCKNAEIFEIHRFELGNEFL